MRRATIYLTDEQLVALRDVAERRGEPVAVLVREAVGEWLGHQRVRPLSRDQRASRFEALLSRRNEILADLDASEEQIERDVMEVVREVRKERASRSRLDA